MNDIHSGSESLYLPRWVEPTLAAAVNSHPVVVVSGARQVGKTTLLRNAPATAGWAFRSFDEMDALDQATRDPAALWAGTDCIVLDEVQRAPQVLLAVKQAVDSRSGPGRFVLSGSANLLVMKGVSETLAGRAVYLELLPMTLGETKHRPPPDLLSGLLSGRLSVAEQAPSLRAGPCEAITRGFMPRLLSYGDSNEVVRWWEGYVLTYLERDLRQLSQVSSLPDFRRLMTALALRTGQLLNQTEVARDLGLSQPTVHRYVNLLETAQVGSRLPAYAASRTTRLVKSPKFYWTDPGLAAHLAGYYNVDSVSASREVGHFFENLVLHHLRALCAQMVPRAPALHWRTTGKREVDFVIEWGQRLLPIEVKLTKQARYADCQTLEQFLSQYEQAVCGLLVYAGATVEQLGERVFAVPWECLAAGEQPV